MRSRENIARRRQIAEDEGLTEEQVLDIVSSPYLFVIEKMREADKEKLDFSNIRIMKLGSFVVTEQKRNFLKKLNEKNKIRENGNTEN